MPKSVIHGHDEASCRGTQFGNRYASPANKTYPAAQKYSIPRPANTRYEGPTISTPTMVIKKQGLMTFKGDAINFNRCRNSFFFQTFKLTESNIVEHP